jgi:hypothetical protein
MEVCFVEAADVLINASTADAWTFGGSEAIRR